MAARVALVAMTVTLGAETVMATVGAETVLTKVIVVVVVVAALLLLVLLVVLLTLISMLIWAAVLQVLRSKFEPHQEPWRRCWSYAAGPTAVREN